MASIYSKRLCFIPNDLGNKLKTYFKEIWLRMRWLRGFLLRFPFYRRIVKWAQSVLLPGFGPLSLYAVIVFFVEEFLTGSLVSKASSLSYSFMLAIFPATIFLVTLIPYVPISHFQDNLLGLLSSVLPNASTSTFF